MSTQRLCLITFFKPLAEVGPALAAAGQQGVERALELMQTEIERDMRLMGVKSIKELSRDNLRFR